MVLMEKKLLLLKLKEDINKIRDSNWISADIKKMEFNDSMFLLYKNNCVDIKEVLKCLH